MPYSRILRSIFMHTSTPIIDKTRYTRYLTPLNRFVMARCMCTGINRLVSQDVRHKCTKYYETEVYQVNETELKTKRAAAFSRFMPKVTPPDVLFLYARIIPSTCKHVTCQAIPLYQFYFKPGI